MEILPKIIESKRIPLQIKVDPYLLDHSTEGIAVLPAVIAMEILAESTAAFTENVDTNVISNARFLRFLEIDPGVSEIEAFNEVSFFDNGTIKSHLETTVLAGKAKIKRAREHVILEFTKETAPPSIPPGDIIYGLEGICSEISSEIIYSELVPFGPAFQNISEKVLLTQEGTICSVTGGTANDSRGLLGSPFPLDAAFHGACVWGQKFSCSVGFPIGFKKRTILKKTEFNRTYFCRTIPVNISSGEMIFDIYIADDSGDLYEKVEGVIMKDVSGGRRKPPQWINAENETGDLDAIADKCKDFSLFELRTVTEGAQKVLSDPEQQRFSSMKYKRKENFLAARLASKRISRRISGNDMETDPHHITTVLPDKRPTCPVISGKSQLYCSVSHDSRFAVAVVSEKPIGIDIEKISDRVLTGQHYYMNESEMALVKNSAEPEIEISCRIWTIKEALSKAAGIKLPQAWEKTTILRTEADSSVISFDEKEYTAYHAVVDNHLLTLILL